MRRPAWFLLCFVAILATSAVADLCPKCKDHSYTKDIGECTVCKGPTSSGQFPLCVVCSGKLNQCEHCRAPLAAATAPATQPALSLISLKEDGTYTSDRWEYRYVVTNKGSRSEGYRGTLLFDGRMLAAPAGINDHYRTPWGDMYWVGDPHTAFGSHGWMPKPLVRERVGSLLADPGEATAVYVKVIAPDRAAMPNAPAIEPWIAEDLKKMGVAGAAVQQDWAAMSKEFMVLHDSRHYGLAKVRLATIQEDGSFAVEVSGADEVKVVLPPQNGATKLIRYTLASSIASMDLYLAFKVEMPTPKVGPAVTSRPAATSPAK